MIPTILKYKWPERSNLSRGAFEIVRKLRVKGHQAFIAGGAVRDVLLKRKLSEIDIATSAKPGEVEKLFLKTIPTGKKHGTITVRLNKTSYEVTTFRTEGVYEKFRRPLKVYFSKNVEIDVARRDFTINALFYDPEKKEIIDYVDSVRDLASKKIKFVGSASERLQEDALRLLRAVRFAAVLDFELDREARRAIKTNAKLITNVSAERVKMELDKILLSKNCSMGIGLLDIMGLLVYILPELKNTQGVRQPRNQHAEGDVYAHSLLSLEQADETFDLGVRYAILFHDLGKAKTAKIIQKKITYYNHQSVGEELVKKIAKRLKFSTHETARISWLVKNHMVPNDFVSMKLSTRRKWGLNLHFADLLKVYLADARASLPPSGKPDMNPKAYREGLKIMKEIASLPALARPIISGNDVMKILKIKEGPRVGEILKIVEEKKLAGEIKTKTEAIELLKKISA
jgi:tRNA nucleotidyltransferase/poly(A) polymerase